MTELASADVHRQREVGRFRPRTPSQQLSARGFQHPLAQGLDQPRFLGQGNELGGSDQAAARMLPTHQRLGARDAAVTIHLRLGVKNELAFPHASAQLDLQDGAGGDHGLHPRIEEAQRIAARCLGLIHGEIRPFQQVIDRLPMFTERGAADAPGAVMFVAGEEVGRRERGEDLLADDLGLGCGVLRTFAQLLQHHDELVAAQAGHGVARAHTR